MMEKAIKQRLLGGLVLVAGAALFLPVLLDGSGAALTIPPMPAAPEVAGVEGMAPRLDQKVAEAGAEVAAAHEGRDASPPAAVAADADASEVAPDAAALAVGDGAPAADPPAAPVVTAAPAAAKPAPAAPTSTATASTAQPKAAPLPAKPAPAAALPAAKPVAPSTAAVARPEAKPEPRPAAKAEPKPAEPRADKLATGAWMIQVARVSSREKAQDLLRKLRAKGYPAVLSQQGDSWKVMVGPELSREVATSTKNRLNADAAIGVNDAWVQAYKP